MLYPPSPRLHIINPTEVSPHRLHTPSPPFADPPISPYHLPSDPPGPAPRSPPSTAWTRIRIIDEEPQLQPPPLLSSHVLRQLYALFSSPEARRVFDDQRSRVRPSHTPGFATPLHCPFTEGRVPSTESTAPLHDLEQLITRGEQLIKHMNAQIAGITQDLRAARSLLKAASHAHKKTRFRRSHKTKKRGKRSKPQEELPPPPQPWRETYT